jgi:3-deoxy-manno-octulosonate cytidylyltransferase (CMP-KDO synthetase)
MQPLEIAEKIECIRYLEYGMKIKMIETDFVGVGIDVPEDLEKARSILKNNQSF